MHNNASEQEIIEFLTKAKQLLKEGKYGFLPRTKNLISLAQEGLSISDTKTELQKLLVDDYYRGPDPDNAPNQSGDVWAFKKSINGKVFYIKMKIVNSNGIESLRCLSFHE